MKCSPLGWLVSFGLLAAGFPAVAQVASDAKLRAFEEKITASEEKEDEARFPESQRRARFVSQIKMLRAYLSREEIDRAQQLLEGGYLQDLPVEWQREWFDLRTALVGDMENRRTKAMEKWRAEVDALLRDVQAECPKAESAAALDPLLVRCAALQMQRFAQQDIINQRTVRKLSGIADTLQGWTNYLDFRTAGNIPAANQALLNLAKNSSQFPVLTQDQIEARIAVAKPEPAAREAFRKVLAGIGGIEDLEPAVKQLLTLASQPDPSGNQMLNYEKAKVEHLSAAWRALNAGNYDAMLSAVERFQSAGGDEDLAVHYDRLRGDFVKRLFAVRLQPLSNLQQEPKEDLQAYVVRVLAQLQAKEDYAGMVEVIKLAERLFRTTGGFAITQDRTAIERFLAARRFEAAGDFLVAVNEYRAVVSAVGGPYAPTKQASEALQRLKEKSPEIFNDATTIVLQEIRSLKQQIMMNRGLPGRPPF